MTTQQTLLLPAEHAILMKERATLLDRLALVEQLLSMPSSIVPKEDRERRRYEQRVRNRLTGRGE